MLRNPDILRILGQSVFVTSQDFVTVLALSSLL